MWPQVTRNTSSTRNLDVWSNELGALRNAKWFAKTTNHEPRPTSRWCGVDLCEWVCCFITSLETDSYQSHEQLATNNHKTTVPFNMEKLRLQIKCCKKFRTHEMVLLLTFMYTGRGQRINHIHINGESIILYSPHWQGSPCMWSRPYMSPSLSVLLWNLASDL